VQQHRRAVLQNYGERLQSRLQELLGTTVDRGAGFAGGCAARRSQHIQEEMFASKLTCNISLGLLEKGGEIGKKLDFLLQEMNREANTLLSKTSGLAREGSQDYRGGIGHEGRN